MHEWSYDVEEEPKTFVDDEGNIAVEKEKIENLVRWVYERGSFVPCTKIFNGESYTIVSDYIGRPVQSFSENGEIIWSIEYDIFGKIKNLEGQQDFIPFRQLGQYKDLELDLYYNRFRYYDIESGNYISKDPIGLQGGLSLYNYIKDINWWVDIFGLSGTGGAYLFGFTSGDKYIGKGEIGRMNQSISTRTSQVGRLGGDNTLIGKAHVSTGGNNDLGKMVEYKAMKDAGFRPGGAGVPADYLNSHMSGKSTWDANPQLQTKATELADKLRADYDADVKAKAKVNYK